MVDLMVFEYAIYLFLGLVLLPTAVQYLSTIRLYTRKKIHFQNFLRKYTLFYPKSNRKIVGYYLLITGISFFIVLYFLFIDFRVYIYFTWYFALILLIAGIGVLREITQAKYVYNIDSFLNAHQRIKEIEDNTDKYLKSTAEKKDNVTALYQHYQGLTASLEEYFTSQTPALNTALEPLQESEKKLAMQLTHIHNYINDLKESFNRSLFNHLSGEEWATDLSALENTNPAKDEILLSDLESQVITNVNQHLEDKLLNDEYKSPEHLAKLLEEISTSKFSLTAMDTHEFLHKVATFSQSERETVVNALYKGDYINVDDLVDLLSKNDWDWLINERFKEKLSADQFERLIQQQLSNDALKSTLALIRTVEEDDYKKIHRMIDTTPSDSDSLQMIKNYLELNSYENSFINPSNRIEMFTVILQENLAPNAHDNYEEFQFIKRVLENGHDVDDERKVIDLYLTKHQTLTPIHEASSLMLVYYQKLTNHQDSYISNSELKRYLNESLITLRTHEIETTLYLMMMIVLIYNSSEVYTNKFLEIVKTIHPADYQSLTSRKSSVSAKDFYRVLLTDDRKDTFFNVLARIESQRLTIDRLREYFDTGGSQ